MKLSKISWERWRKGASSEPPRIFTEHVRSLAAGDGSRFPEGLWEALRVALRSELKQRGLWDLPPSFLGVHGWERWDLSGGTKGSPGGALEELLAECYFYVFVSRLPGLQAQLKIKDNIDGLVFLNIRHFLHDRQAEHDPIGSQTFVVLQSAVRLAVAEGELRVLQGDEKIRNDTVLAFGMATEAATPARDIAALAARWNDELLPDLVTARGRRMEEVVLHLRRLLSELSDEGIEAFRFRELIEPLKADVRARWAALLEGEQGEKVKAEGGEVVSVVRPNTRLEERQLFRKLVDCVLSGLAGLEVNEKTRGYLTTLWQFLRIQAGGGLGRSLSAELEAEGEGPLSHRRLAEHLRIPRDRLLALFRTLGELLEGCRESVAHPGPAEGVAR